MKGLGVGQHRVEIGIHFRSRKPIVLKRLGAGYLRITLKFLCTPQLSGFGAGAVTSRMCFFAYSFRKACLSMRSTVEKMTMPRTKMINESAFEYYHRLRNIKRFIEEHYTEDIPLKKAARVAGLEKKYFSTFFHRKVGVGFKHWLTQVRVARAIDLIRAEDYSISEVAYAAGFKDMRTFERAFKKCTSRTPRDFKNRVRPS